MWTVFRKEVNSFFASPAAYLIIGVYLVLNSLFLWVFEGPFNVMDYGFADLNNFFLFSPWVFLLLIPAICMKSFSEEIKLGTLELLFIKPIGLWKLVIGKYLAAVLLALLALLPTFLYVYTVFSLVNESTEVDIGLVLGSYLGLFFLILCYAGISIYASSITDNPIVAFVAALVLCFIFYYFWEALSTEFDHIAISGFFSGLSLNSRFETMARGILDTRDLVYFLSIAIFFIYLTVLRLKSLRI